MATATLEEMFPGRVILCLGVGAPADLQAAGIAASRPLTTLAEAIGVCRALLAGELVEHDGQIFRLHGRRLVNGGRSIPIVLAIPTADARPRWPRRRRCIALGCNFGALHTRLS
jgi:5,10-methylenetetrahydromethanopterin reductase